MAPDPDLPLRIGRLDAGALTAFVDALLRAEFARLALPAAALVMSTELNVADDGLDAVLHGVPPGGPLPAGMSGWQLKAYKRTAPSALKLEEELAKPAPRRLLADGGTYVLLWPRELDKRQHDAVMRRLRDGAPGTPPERLVLFDVTAVTALAERHPAVVQQFGLSAFAALRTIEELGRQLQAETRPYATDAPRDAIAERLAALLTAPGPAALRAVVLGLPGTGKTRVVYEALVRAGLDDDALYADTWEGMEQFLAWVAREPRSHGLLVVDDTGPAADPRRSTDSVGGCSTAARRRAGGSSRSRASGMGASRPHVAKHRRATARPRGQRVLARPRRPAAGRPHGTRRRGFRRVSRPDLRPDPRAARRTGTARVRGPRPVPRAERAAQPGPGRRRAARDARAAVALRDGRRRRRPASRARGDRRGLRRPRYADARSGPQPPRRAALRGEGRAVRLRDLAGARRLARRRDDPADRRRR